MSTVPDLVAALAGSFTPDASDAMAEVLERRAGVDSLGCFRRLAAALRAAAERWLVDNPEPQPITEENRP